jgi:hypothetical protein
MIIFIVVVMSLMMVLAVALAPHAVDEGSKQIEQPNSAIEMQTERPTTQHVTTLPKKVMAEPVVKAEPVKVVVKEVTPQINNYNFESLSKVLMYVLAMVGSFFSLKWLIKLFKYYKTNRKFKINAKKTNKLVDSLRKTIDNQKEFLEIADMIEHQLNINDILLRSEESKTYGLDLELADGYLDKEYKFINSKLINILN